MRVIQTLVFDTRDHISRCIRGLLRESRIGQKRERQEQAQAPRDEKGETWIVPPVKVAEKGKANMGNSETRAGGCFD